MFLANRLLHWHRSQKYWERRKNATVLRKEAFKMYKKGASYHQISLKLFIPTNSIESLLSYEPE